jgi:flagellar protein FlaG
MAIDFINHFPSNPLGNLLPFRSAPAKENAEAQVRQPPVLAGNEVSEDGRTDITVDETNASQAVVDLNDYVQRVGRDLHFSLDKESGKIIIKVLNSETKELIRQIPPEEVLQLAQILEQTNNLTSTGLLEKV